MQKREEDTRVIVGESLYSWERGEIKTGTRFYVCGRVRKAVRAGMDIRMNRRDAAGAAVHGVEVIVLLDLDNLCGVTDVAVSDLSWDMSLSLPVELTHDFAR